MRTCFVTFQPAISNECLGMAHRQESILVQAFISDLAIEAFNTSILLRFARLDKSQREPLLIGPDIRRFADELWPFIHRDTALQYP